MRRGATLLFFVAALYAVVFYVWGWRGRVQRGLRLEATRVEHLHFDIVDLRLVHADPALESAFVASPPRVVVEFAGEPVTTIGGLRELTLKRSAPGVWTARWPVPWNAPPGEYRPRLLGRAELSERLAVAAFRIGRRAPRPIPREGVVAATLESVMPLTAMRVTDPEGREKDWTGLLDWTKSLGADTFWMLGGQTPGLRGGETWVETNREMIPKVAAECRRRGLKFGVYVMYSLTMSEKNKVPGYEYALDVKDSVVVPTRAISIRDRKRLDDAIAFLAPFAKDPNVDFVGLDYIRNALGGVELVDDFVAEMPGVAVPSDWKRLTREERMVWLARKKAMRRDDALVDAWQWWRARRVALIVREIKARLGDKPLWAFTLTWDKGWHHGQDPVMMNDAGVDYDALMFYEADKAQYAAMLRDWSAYVRRGDVQLVPGNIFDWGLHQKDPSGPAEFGRRLRRAVEGVYSDGPARGVFYHDLARLLWGRRGAWGVASWAEEARKISRLVKSIPPEVRP